MSVMTNTCCTYSVYGDCDCRVFFFLCCLRPQAQIRGSRVAHLQGRGQVVEFRLQAVRHERGARRHDRSAEHQVRVLRIVRVLFFFQSL